MNTKSVALVFVLLLIGAAGVKLFAHCQIPCGIYNDPVRVALLNEHVTTIEKSMKEINRLSDEAKPNWNQINRWVMNKETHADELTSIVTFYFMAQRIKPVDTDQKETYSKYLHEITLLHHMVVYAMKAKQTTDVAHVEKLRSLVHDFSVSYLGEKEADHKH